MVGVVIRALLMQQCISCERDALKALDVGVLVEIAHHIHRRALIIYELEQLAFITRDTLFLPAFSASLSLCDFGRASRLGFRVGLHLSSRLSLSSFKLRLHISIMEAFGQLVTSQKGISRTPRISALHALEA